ncbi:hypothetical protein JOM56_015778, partial [Amanita muscaria]
DDSQPEEEAISHIENVSFTQQLIHELNKATLDNDKLDPDVIDRLRNPTAEPVDISNPDVRLSLDLFMACSNTSEATYAAVRESVMRRFPGTDVLSYYLAKKMVADISGVDAVLDDMCINSCTAFIGPLADAMECPECQEQHFKVVKSGKNEKKVARHQACTIPLGPQLQAL